jgi:hypothetical protein
MDVATLGFYYALPLTLWILFVAILTRVLSGGTLEDSFVYLVILRSRRNRFTAFMMTLAVSQIVKDAIQLAWASGSLSDSAMLVSAIACNTLSAAAVVGLAWTLLSKGSLTPVENRVLFSTAEALYAVGRPEALAYPAPAEQP